MKNPTIEAAKEIGRWVVLFALSWVITETVNQLVRVPEFAQLNVWVFTYMIPVRLLLQVGLTTVGRVLDRLIHESESIKLNGIIPW